MRDPNSQPVKRNWNVTGRELSPWRLFLLVFPPPIGLVVGEAFGLIPGIIAGTLAYLGIIWLVISIPKKDQVGKDVESTGSYYEATSQQKCPSRSAGGPLVLLLKNSRSIKIRCLGEESSSATLPMVLGPTPTRR